MHPGISNRPVIFDQISQAPDRCFTQHDTLTCTIEIQHPTTVYKTNNQGQPRRNQCLGGETKKKKKKKKAERAKVDITEAIEGNIHEDQFDQENDLKATAARAK